MSVETDRYRDWDAAYVLGSLSPAERLEYEEHLVHCPECQAALADLAGMPSLLSRVSSEEALDLLADVDRAAVAVGARALSAAPPTLLPTLLSRARAARRRSRLRVVGIGVGSVAAAVALTLVTALVLWPAGGSGGSSAGGTGTSTSTAGAALVSQVQFVPQVSGSLSAVASLHDEPWGTRIEWKCTWESGSPAPGGAAPGGTPPGGTPPGGTPPSGAPATVYSDAPPVPPTTGVAAAAAADQVGYGLIVTDRAGNSVQVATWTSDPGSVATPTATTSMRLADIATMSIVMAGSGQVLLTSTL